MSHVVSSQPSCTSPYQPTEIQENNSRHSRIKSTMETRQDRDDCCFRADKSQGCFLYYCCNFLSSVCGGIRDCVDSCCSCCADCLNECCEDKPEDRNKRKRYRNSVDQDDYNYYDGNTLVIGSTQRHNMVIGSDDTAEHRPETYEPSVCDSGNQDTTIHHSSKHESNVHHSSSHDSGHHNSSHCHDSQSSGFHSSGHNSGGHHSSNHDSGGHHSSSNDTGGNYDSGGGTCDSGGGGDSGGGCDSGGGGDTGGCD